MRHSHVRSSLVACLLFCAAGAFALPPNSAKQFPAYPKAVVVKDAAEGATAQLPRT